MDLRLWIVDVESGTGVYRIVHRYTGWMASRILPAPDRRASSAPEGHGLLRGVERAEEHPRHLRADTPQRDEDERPLIERSRQVPEHDERRDEEKRECQAEPENGEERRALRRAHAVEERDRDPHHAQISEERLRGHPHRRAVRAEAGAGRRHFG